jgi:hypothetical protein
MTLEQFLSEIAYSAFQDVDASYHILDFSMEPPDNFYDENSQEAFRPVLDEFTTGVLKAVKDVCGYKYPAPVPKQPFLYGRMLLRKLQDL